MQYGCGPLNPLSPDIIEIAYSSYCSPHISYRISKENRSKYQDHLILDDHFLYPHHLNV